MNKIILNDLLALTNADRVMCRYQCGRLDVTVTADIRQTAQLDDLSAIYGDWEVVEVTTGHMNGAGVLDVAIRRGGDEP